MSKAIPSRKKQNCATRARCCARLPPSFLGGGGLHGRRSGQSPVNAQPGGHKANHPKWAAAAYGRRKEA
eukprot:4302101-Alexandrium_andersonii.AAC.1